MAAITADGLFTLDNNADINGNTDVSGTLDVTGATTLSSTLEVTGNADLNGDLDVDGTSNLDNTDIDGTLDASSSAVFNSDRNSGNVFTVYDENIGNALLVNADGNVYVQDLNITNSLSITGSVTAAGFVTTAGDPTSDNQLARKAYVDAQIAAEVGAVDAYDYAATASDITNSGGGSLTYYLNGALLLYEDHTAGDQLNANKGYTITVYGDGFAAGQTAVLWCRGTQTDLVTGNNWAAAVDGNSATFTVTYNQLVASAGGSQTDGVVRCHLVVDGKNTGLSLKFHLDSTSAAATTTSFN
jgi:cytoskeletal protein CcmA (bactofilin family)